MSPGRDLRGKVAVVTGGARRVGRAVAMELARAGMDVAITYNRSRAQAEEVVANIEEAGRGALAVQVELADPDCAEQVFQAVTRRFDRVDVLVNNASVFAPTPLDELTVAAYDLNQAINARAPLMLIRRFAPLLGRDYDPRDPDSPGRVINFIDIHVMGEPLPGFIAYNCSKAALMEITASCAVELAPRVTVNAIAPGVVDWTEWYTEEERRRYLTRVPLGRPGSPLDAARAVLYLVRDASYCTGQVLRLDGGRFLT